eukprot:1087602-Amphidinium_carterae.1
MQQEAFRQHYEAGLLRMARTGQAVLAHAWPSWIDSFPPTAPAQQEILEGRNAARKSQKGKDSRKAWQNFVKEAW